MNRHDCDICRGEGVVRLPSRPRMSASPFNLATFEQTVQISQKTFGCPQCSAQVPLTSLHVMGSNINVRLSAEYRGGMIEGSKRDIAAAIGAGLLERGMIEFKEREDIKDGTVIVGTVAIASPDRLPAIEEMLTEREQATKKALIEETMRLIQLTLGDLARRHNVRS